MPEPSIKHTARRIDVWESQLVRIQREGATMAVQMLVNKQVTQFTIPVAMTEELVSLLRQASAIQATQPGDVIVPGEAVPHQPV